MVFEKQFVEDCFSLLGTGLRREKALNPVSDLLHLSVLRVNDHIVFSQSHQLLQI